MKLEHGLFSAALVMVLVSVGWIGQKTWRGGERGELISTPRSQAVVMDGTSVENALDDFDSWAMPLAQDRGDEWVFEVFTPPEISFDLKTKRWSAVSANSPTQRMVAADKPADLELLEVRFLPYRMQLVGYAGESGDLRGLFSIGEENQLIWAHPGQKFPELDIEIGSIGVKSLPVFWESEPAMAGRYVVASIRDGRSGKILELAQNATLPSDDLGARFRDKPGLWRKGDLIPYAQGAYIIGKLSAAPTTVELIDRDNPTRLRRLNVAEAKDAAHAGEPISNPN